MGPLALAGAGLARLADFAILGRFWLQSSFCAGLLLILGLLSWQRAWAYESEETLWADTLAQDPNCWAAHNNLGWVLYQKGRVQEAIVQYQKALEIKPNYAEARNNLGIALFEKGQLDEAIAQYQKALGINPNFAKAHNNLGNALLEKGQVDEAIVEFQEAVRLKPDDGDAQDNLARAQSMPGQSDAHK